MATMQGSTASQIAARHVHKYMNEKVLQEHKFTLARKFGILEPGDQVKVRSVEVVKDIYHANTEFGLIPITKLHKPPIGRAKYSPEAAEDYQIKLLQESVSELLLRHRSVVVRFGSEHHPVWHEIAGVEKVNETIAGKKVKADAYFMNEHGDPVVWVSLKAGENPRDFQQWGGVADLEQHEAIQEFREKLAHHIDPDEGFPKRMNIAMVLDPGRSSHLDVSLRTMFGPDCYSDDFGVNNVNYIIGGQPSIHEDESGLTFNAPLCIQNGMVEIDHLQNQIVARYNSDRTNLGFKNTRIGIMPIGSRKVNVYV